MTRWFEDIELDVKYPLGSHTFEEAEIIRFATQIDPQYFHTNPDDAAHSEFGGLIASGWHTACIGHKLLVDAMHAQKLAIEAAGEQAGEAGPSPGVNEMSFKTPVRPGDSVTYDFYVVSKRSSKSLPGWGLVIQRIEAHNQDAELVFKNQFAGFVRMRDYTPTLGQRVKVWAMAQPLLRKVLAR